MKQRKAGDRRHELMASRSECGREGKHACIRDCQICYARVCLQANDIESSIAVFRTPPHVLLTPVISDMNKSRPFPLSHVYSLHPSHAHDCRCAKRGWLSCRCTSLCSFCCRFSACLARIVRASSSLCQRALTRLRATVASTKQSI